MEDGLAKIKTFCISELTSLQNLLDHQEEKAASERRRAIEEATKRVNEILEHGVQQFRDAQAQLEQEQDEENDAAVVFGDVDVMEVEDITDDPEDKLMAIQGLRSVSFHQKRNNPTTQTEIAVARYIHKFRRWWRTLREPKRTGPLAKFVYSWKFETFMSIVIFANTIEVVYHINTAMLDQDFSWDAREFVFDTCWLILYTFEFLVRFIVHRFYMFVNEDAAWTWLDTFLLATGYVGWVAGFQQSGSDIAANATSFRIVRYLRLFKVLRVLRILRFFREAVFLMNSMFHTMHVLFLSGCVLFFCLAVMAAIIVQGIGTYMESEDWQPPEAIQRDVDRYFKSLPVAMMTMIEISLGGLDWSDIVRMLGRFGILEPTVIVVYLVFHQCILSNIFTGMVLFSMEQLRTPEADADRMEKKELGKLSSQYLRHLMMRSMPGTSVIRTEQEMQRLLGDPSLLDQLEKQTVDPADIALFFTSAKPYFPEGVPIDVIAEGSIGMHGLAVQFDVHLIMVALRQHFLHQESLDRDMKVRMDMFERRLNMHQVMGAEGGGAPTAAALPDETKPGKGKQRYPEELLIEDISQRGLSGRGKPPVAV